MINPPSKKYLKSVDKQKEMDLFHQFCSAALTGILANVGINSYENAYIAKQAIKQAKEMFNLLKEINNGGN